MYKRCLYDPHPCLENLEKYLQPGSMEVSSIEYWLDIQLWGSNTGRNSRINSLPPTRGGSTIVAHPGILTPTKVFTHYYPCICACYSEGHILPILVYTIPGCIHAPCLKASGLCTWAFCWQTKRSARVANLATFSLCPFIPDTIAKICFRWVYSGYHIESFHGGGIQDRCINMKFNADGWIQCRLLNKKSPLCIDW